MASEPTMPDGPSAEDVRASLRAIGVEYYPFDVHFRFAAALWSRWQQQADVEAVKREAVRDFIATIDDAYGPEWTRRTIGQEPIAWHWFRRKYPAAPPVREPRHIAISRGRYVWRKDGVWRITNCDTRYAFISGLAFDHGLTDEDVAAIVALAGSTDGQ